MKFKEVLLKLNFRLTSVRNFIDLLSTQTMLRLVAGNIIPHHKIGQHSVDIFIPDWNVAIEYQGVQHSKQHWRGDFNR